MAQEVMKQTAPTVSREQMAQRSASEANGSSDNAALEVLKQMVPTTRGRADGSRSVEADGSNSQQ